MSEPMRTLADRYRAAFITGASAGLGEAFARLLLAEGVPVWGTARSPERLAGLAADPAFHAVTLDLANGDRVLAVYDTASAAAGGFDLVINNAGYGVFAPFADEPFATWEAQVAAMLVQPMRLAQRALQDFRRQTPAAPRGTLVNVASLAVEFPLPYMSGYNVVKAGLSAFSESLLVETAGTEISVIDFRPGDYRTGFNRAMVRTASTVQPPQGGAAAPALAWRALEAHMAAAPGVERAAADLRRALRRGVRGTVRSGSLFQATLAPSFGALLPQALRRALRWRYFGLR